MKATHGQSTELGDVAKYIAVESSVSSPLKVSLIDWDSDEFEETELQKSIRSLESKQTI